MLTCVSAKAIDFKEESLAYNGFLVGLASELLPAAAYECRPLHHMAPNLVDCGRAPQQQEFPVREIPLIPQSLLSSFACSLPSGDDKLGNCISTREDDICMSLSKLIVSLIGAMIRFQVIHSSNHFAHTEYKLLYSENIKFISVLLNLFLFFQNNQK